VLCRILAQTAEALKHKYTLVSTSVSSRRGEVSPIISNVVYENAFKNSEKEWLETQFEHPTAPNDDRAGSGRHEDSRRNWAKSVACGPTDSSPLNPPFSKTAAEWFVLNEAAFYGIS